jgi:protein-disulfide isomerase
MRTLPAILLLSAVLGCAGIVAFAASSGGRLDEAISEHADEIYRGEDPVVGDSGAEVPVVLFTDFNCPDCRKADPAIERLIEEQKGVKLIVKQLPILGDDSEIAARIALAADAQGKYWALHKALFETRGRITQTRALRIAEDLGLDMDRLKQEANGDEVSATLAKTFLVADALDVPGVPFMLVGDKRVLESGDLYGDLTEAVAEIRAEGCTARC